MQEFIGKFYFTLSKKIDLLHRQNKTLEALAQTLFRHWFVDGAGDDWAEHKLEEFVEVMRGLSYKGAGLRDGVDGVPMHNLNSVYEGGGYKYEGIKYYDGPYQERHKIFPGDIIITNTEQGHNFLLIGYPAVVPRIFGDEGIFSQHIYRLNIFNPQISNQFLYYLLMSFDVREQIIGATNGSTVNMLPKDGIEWATFKLPPQNLVNQFSDMAQQYWDKREANYLQIRTLEKLRDTLLPKLMSGEARVSAVSEIAKLESHELFDRAGYLAAMFADAVQPVAAGTAKARTGWQESNIPLAWFAIPETLYQLSEQPFPTLIGQTIYQKLCYVLTDEGVNTGFTFVQHNYGPHSSDAVQALARLETMGVIAQVSVGRMTELRVQALYRAQRTRILEELKQFQPMIARTVELFNHVKDTDHAEEIATILYSARQIEQKLAQRNIPRNELHEYMLTWKPHWNRGNKRERLDRAINGLVKMGFIVIQ